MSLINNLESLPAEIIGETLSSLSNDELYNVCQQVSRRIRDVCNKNIVPIRIKQIVGDQQIFLPYDEPDPLKRLVLIDSIYGSSALGASFVNPDYAIYMAIKLGNDVIVEEYLKYSTVAPQKDHQR